MPDGKVGLTRAPVQVLRDQKIEAELYLKGKPMYEIAETLGLSRPTVIADMKAIQERWLSETTTAIAEARAREIAKLNLLEGEYWKGWERSYEDAVIVTEEETDKGYKNKTQRKGQAGDPRFLDGINRCVENRCKILGITLDVSLNINIDVLPLEYLERIVNGESEVDVYADWQRQQLPGQEVVEAAFQPDPLPVFSVPVLDEQDAAAGDDQTDGSQETQDASDPEEGDAASLPSDADDLASPGTAGDGPTPDEDDDADDLVADQMDEDD